MASPNMLVPHTTTNRHIRYVTLVDMTTAEQRLFTPGARATPPALTGREREQALLPGCPPPTRVRRDLPWPRWSPATTEDR